MLFNSFLFLLFFVITTIVYYFSPHKFRWFILLVASICFYMVYIPVYILIIAFTIIVDFFAGILIENSEGARKKLFLYASIIANVGILIAFKYYNFFLDTFSGLYVISDNLYLSIALPVGLSFHTFQAMSYTIEVYRGNQKAERRLGIYSLYVLFFPQMVAGPIERPQNMLHQFDEEKKIDYEGITNGLRLMGWGLFLKVVIADRLAIVVDTIYDSPFEHNGFILALATFCFSFQIYFDFSGYSIIARGAARVLGFELMNNFNLPYLSKSISEFWTRWHISLSTWFKDYVYIPMGGNRVSRLRWAFNILVVFMISGIWHGANLTFVVWGFLHGFFQLMEFFFNSYFRKFTSVVGPKTRHVMGILITFSLVTFGWIFFRARNITEAIYITRKILTDFLNSFINILTGHSTITYYGMESWQLLLSFILIGVVYLIECFQLRINLEDFFVKQPGFVRWLTYYLLFICIVFLGINSSRQFIYFQF